MSTQTAPQHRTARYIIVGTVSCLIVGIVIAAHYFGWLDFGRVRMLATRMRRHAARPRTIVIFVALYVLVVVFALPATPMNLVGGAVFGFWLGLLLNWSGLMLSATASYWIAYVLGRNTLDRLLDRIPHWQTTVTSIKRPRGLFALIRLQAIPVMPPAVLNYAAGVERIPFRRYLLSAALGHIVPTAIFTYFADRLLAGATGTAHRVDRDIGIAFGLVLLISFLPALLRRWTHRD